MLPYDYSFSIITITPPSDVIAWWLILAYFTTISYYSLAFSFAYLILHHKLALDTRNTVYKGSLDRYLSL